MKTLHAVFGAALLSATVTPAMVEAAQTSPADQTFVTQAASGGMAEVALGSLAQRNAASPQVKQFGQRMVTDHTKINDELKAIAQKQGLKLPRELDAKDQATEKQLSELKGEAFDTAYMRDMVQDHRQDIAEFRQEADSATDPALKSFAQQTLPVLEQHLQLAENVRTAQK